MGEVMTKTEFGEQFKRLRVAGYRLPVFDDVKIGEVIDEWYATFQSCSVAEFSHAIDKLKQSKTDTWWPASGELWSHVFQYRKERRIRNESNMADDADGIPSHVRQELAAQFREFARRLSAQMTMPHAEVQVEPDHVLLEHEDADRLRDELA